MEQTPHHEHAHGLGGKCIMQIVLFNGHIFSMIFSRFHIIQLAPQFIMHNVEDFCREEIVVSLCDKAWLVLCGNTLCHACPLGTMTNFTL